MKKQVGLYVLIYLSVCTLFLGISASNAWSQNEKTGSSKAVLIEERTLLESLLNQFLNTRDLCEENVFSEESLKECAQEQTQKRKEIEQKLKTISWSSPYTLDWLVEWATQKGRVTANDLPDLTLITNEEYTLSFLRRMLPGNTVSDSEIDPNSEDIILKLLASWHRNSNPKSELFLTQLRDFLYSKYKDQSLLRGYGLMFHYDAWFGDIRALNRAEKTINNFLKKKGLSRFFQSLSYDAKEQFRRAALAIKEFDTSDKALQKRAAALLQEVLDSSRTPDTIKKSLR